MGLQKGGRSSIIRAHNAYCAKRDESMLRRLLDKLRTLRVSLMLIVLLCWLLPTLILGGYIGSRLFGALREKTEAAMLSHAEHVGTLLTGTLDGLVTLSKAATYDQELSAAARGLREGTISYSEYFRTARGYLERKYSREPLCGFALFFTLDAPGDLLYTSQADAEAAWFSQNALEAVQRLGDTLDTRCCFYSLEGRAYLVRNLYDTRLQRLGMLVLGLKMQEVLAPAISGGMDGLIRYALTLDDCALGTLLPSEAEAGMAESNGTLLYMQRVENQDYTLVLQAQADRRELYAEMHFFLRLMVGMLALIVPLCVGVMVYVRRRVVRPVALLLSAAGRMREGELGIRVPLSGSGELERLGDAFSEMSVRLRQLIDKSYKEQIALRDARIQAMQSRINPHFLNNALESINWQARIDGDEKVSHMVETLSILLNASIDRSERHLVPLSEELRIADAYLYFVSLRFGERIALEKDVDAALLGAQVPRLVIQVLLENAVEHGISPAGGGHVRLTVFREGEQLHIHVRNDGKLLTPGDVTRIEALLHAESPGEGHVGIRNVSFRLMLLFPGQAGLTIGPDEQGHTLAALHMPYLV